jgi:hypothetical protein
MPHALPSLLQESDRGLWLPVVLIFPAPFHAIDVMSPFGVPKLSFDQEPCPFRCYRGGVAKVTSPDLGSEIAKMAQSHLHPDVGDTFGMIGGL